MKCPFCREKLYVEPCLDGGFAMGCSCAFQGPEAPTKTAACRILTDWLTSIENLRKGRHANPTA